MFNLKVFELVSLILEKEPPSKDRTEIIKYYLLPRNTGIRPLIELPDEEVTESLGAIKRPSKRELDLKKNPNLEEDEAIAKAYKNE